MKEKVKKICQKYTNNEILIYAHADHDGICAAVGLNYLLGDIDIAFSKSFKPTELPNSPNKKLFIICDLLLSTKQIIYLLKNNLEIINFDHHIIRDIRHYNYLCLNPKKIYGKQFISSSGLIWKLFKPKEIAWILGVGSSGDLAITDVMDLFKYINKTIPELVSAVNIYSIYSSKIFELAQILLLAFNNPEEGFNLMNKSINMGYKIMYKSRLYREYLEKQSFLDKFLKETKNRIVKDKFFVIIDSSNQRFSGSYSVRLNLVNKDKRIYVEYDKGRLFFRNYFGDEDIRNLAKLFGGNGAHARAGGAYTRRSFEQVVKTIERFYTQSKQQKLLNFL